MISRRVVLRSAALTPLTRVFPAWSAEEHAPSHGYKIVATYPHDPNAFTQGLIYLDGALYESTGLNARSTLRKVKLETGEPLQLYSLPASFFAEGLTDWGPDLIQITYQTNVGFVYDRATFTLKRSFHYPGEGWGLTHDGKHLIMSDGTAELRFWDPQTLQEVGRLPVKDHGRPIMQLNELEYVRGEIFANVWHTDKIARISPDTGEVKSWIDLSGLRPANVTSMEGVLNGIAYDAAKNRLFVTGKLWPKLFEIQIL